MIGLNPVQAQEHSVARQWNEVVLEGIRNDFAMPTVHARNLFHTSMAMYDAWAAYDPDAEPYFLGRTVGDYFCEFAGVPQPDDVQAAQEEAMSYAMYRLLHHRYQNSPDWEDTEVLIENLMTELGYDPSITSIDYIGATPAEFGNYIASEIIAFGLQDGANEVNGYSNQVYEPVNNDIFVELPGNPDMTDPNRWQPISVSLFIDQSGNPLPTSPPFLSPEWGDVVGFATHDSLKSTYTRDGHEWQVYYDPGDPPYIDPEQQQGLENMYKWGHCMVSVWQSHNDPSDGVMWDISPASIGNIPEELYPDTYEDMPNFYDFFNGLDASQGYDVNPKTGEPYEPQIVPRGDYARVLAEFWADGPDSETPPGHWFTILNYVSDHPELEKRWNGEGEILDDLEWDVRCYFTLGGGMHDAAIAAWSVKGWYDYARPVSAIRYMAEQGQCTDDQLPNYSPAGIPLIPGYIEQIQPGDPLAGLFNENVGEIKLYTWRGPAFIEDPEVDDAGVGWILAANWWPYQRPSFVTPPFAGFVSGHSTYSRAAAEIMTLMTGDEYFPGGMGIFDAFQNEFLVFEEGPSETIELQWAKYYDASDQCSLSRIWGGIHPPADDWPGRRMGMRIGPYAFQHAMEFMAAEAPRVTNLDISDITITDVDAGGTLTLTIDYDREMDSEYSPVIAFPLDDPLVNSLSINSAQWLDADTYEIVYDVADMNEQLENCYVQISGALDMEGKPQSIYMSGGPIVVDTKNPLVLSADNASDMINDAVAALGSFQITLSFDEMMNTSVDPAISFPVEDPLAETLVYDSENSFWSDGMTFVAEFDVLDAEEELADVDVLVVDTEDSYGNPQEVEFDLEDSFSIDTRNPINVATVPSEVELSDDEVGMSLILSFTFDEEMNTDIFPEVTFPDGTPLENSLTPDLNNTLWMNDFSFRAVYILNDAEEELFDLDVATATAEDMAGNFQQGSLEADVFSIDTKNPSVSSISPESNTVADAQVGTAGFEVSIAFDEAMDDSEIPALAYSVVDPLANTLTLNEGESYWSDEQTFVAVYDVVDSSEELEFTTISVDGGKDAFGNDQVMMTMEDVFDVDTRNPEVVIVSANTYNITGEFTGGIFDVLVIFDEPMDQEGAPMITFPLEDPLADVLTPNAEESEWINMLTYNAVFDVADLENYTLLDVDLSMMAFTDIAGNNYVDVYYEDYFDIQINSVGVSEISNFENLNIYPNPIMNSNTFTVEFGENVNGLRYEVYSGNGQLIASESMLNFSGDKIDINTGNWADGLYIVKLNSGDKTSVFRVQKMK